MYRDSRSGFPLSRLSSTAKSRLCFCTWRPGDSVFEVFNPANRQTLAQVAQGSATDVDSAVQAARTAAEQWRTTPGHVRARYLYALARQIQKHSRLFAVLESLDNGKPIRESRDLDIPLVARHQRDVQEIGRAHV